MNERRLIAGHAGTVLVGQLAVMAFGVTDTIVAGRYAEGALAALSVGSAIFISVFVSLTGTVQSLLPVWAELHGARRRAEVGRSVRQSLYVCAIGMVVGMAVLLMPTPLLRWTEIPAALRGDVERYLAILAFALPPTLLFRLFGTLNQSLGKPRFVTWVQLGALAVKVPLSIWLTFGGCGMPALGLAGCGLATLVVNWAMLGCAIRTLRRASFYADYDLWRRIEAPDPRALARFARLGAPAGLAVLVEVTSFTLMALFIARLGTVASAAHQIAANLTAVAYMFPLSLAIATSARVSFWLGAGDPALARRACRTGFELALFCALCAATTMVVLRWQVAGLYTDRPAVVALAATLLLATAGYHLADTVQTLCVFVLRCYRVTVVPLILYCTVLWGVGLGGSYLLAYRGLGPWPAMQSPLAFWLMSALALVTAAALLVVLLRRTLGQAR
ncbi:MAG: MATE family efflux transporter [Janthinobacterium lividum]